MKLDFKRALVLSFAAHIVAAGVGFGWLAWRARNLDAMDIDLSHSSLMPLPANMGTFVTKPPESWYVGDRLKLAPRPLTPPKLTPVAQATPEEEASAPCPPPCPSNAGDWASSVQSVKKPDWIGGMITQDDYPPEASSQNITGLVVVRILLDVDGSVKGVQLLKGSNALLNNETLKKLSQARFSPCVDGSGRPFPCTVDLPINWTLGDD